MSLGQEIRVTALGGISTRKARASALSRASVLADPGTSSMSMCARQAPRHIRITSLLAEITLARSPREVDLVSRGVGT